MTALPLPIPHGLLHHAHNMRANVITLLGDSMPPLTKLKTYHEDMLELVKAGHMQAVDLTVDIAYVLPGTKPDHLILLDPDTLAARIRDIQAMHSRKLN